MRRIFRPIVALLSVVLVILMAGGARDAAAQEIKLKLSHFAPRRITTMPMSSCHGRRRSKNAPTAGWKSRCFPAPRSVSRRSSTTVPKSGIADLAWGVTGWTPGRFPMTSVIELPFLVRTAAVSAQILADLWEHVFEAGIRRRARPLPAHASGRAH